MAGYKTFVAGEEALAADVNGFLMGQTVPRFTNATARTAAITAPVLNQLSMLDTRPGGIDYWTGSAWADISEIAYSQITAPVAVTNTAPSQAHVVIPGTSRTYDGQPILIEFFTPAVIPPAVANGSMLFSVWDGSTDLGYIGQLQGASSQVLAPVNLKRRLVPSAGSHSYLIAAHLGVAGSGASVTAGAGNGAGTWAPAYMRITRA